MESLLVFMLFGAACLFFFGPLVAAVIHTVRIRALEADLRQLRQTVARLTQASPEGPQTTTLAGVSGTLRAKREAAQNEASDDVDEPAVVGEPPLVESKTDASPGNSEADSFEGPTEQADDEPSRSLNSPLWEEFPPFSPRVATTQADADNATELLIVRVMTWAGVTTLVLGVGFLYRFALAQGWVTDVGRAVGGLVVGCLGFASAIFGRRKDYVFFADCLAAASSGVIKLSIYSATVWYGMISAGTGFRGFILGGAALWAYAVFYRSRLAASLATIAALLTPALLPDYVGPVAAANTVTFASYLLVINLTVIAVSCVRGWRLPGFLATVGTGLHLVVWYQQVFEPSRALEALCWLAAFALLFLGHAVVPALRTRVEHPLDSPMLVGGATYLMVASVGVPLSADLTLRLLSPTLLAAMYVMAWTVLRRRLPGFLPDVLGASAGFLVAAAIPLWISPAWSLLPWAVLAWLWAKVALRDDRKIASMIAVTLFVLVQLITVALTFKTVGSVNAMPLSGFDWALTGSVVGQIETMFRGVPIERTSLIGMIFHARSISLLACGAMSFAVLRELRPVNELPRIGLNAANLRRVLGVLAVSNLVGISLSELTHAAVRGDWSFSLAASIWTLHFAMVAGVCCWWSLRDIKDSSRMAIASSLLWVVAISAGCVTLAVLGEAIEPQSIAEVQWPLVSMRAVTMFASLGIVVGIARWLADKSDQEPVRRLRRLASSMAIAILTLILTSETIQFGAWMQLSATEVSALLTGILGVIGVALMTFGFWKRDIGCRRAGLALLGIATLKVYLLDVWSTSSEVRTVAFLVLGATLLGAALLYRRYRDQFADWLGEKNDVLN